VVEKEGEKERADSSPQTGRKKVEKVYPPKPCNVLKVQQCVTTVLKRIYFLPASGKQVVDASKSELISLLKMLIEKKAL
jgi:hypothetical protein